MNDRDIGLSICVLGSTLLLCCVFGTVGLLPDLSNPAIEGTVSHGLAVVVLCGFGAIIALTFGAGFLYRFLRCNHD